MNGGSGVVLAKRVSSGGRKGGMEDENEKPVVLTNNGIEPITSFKEISGLKDGVLKYIYKDENEDDDVF
ncbi:hypothetical protein U1Q18_002174 [Sarracenia purpurea var. burkii]